MSGKELRQKVGILITQSGDRRALEEYLRSQSYDVIAPKTGDVDPDEWRDVSLILADESAARVNQKQLLSLKWRSGPSTLPILVAIPANADSGPFLEAGFDDVLRWPIRKAELSSRMTVFLRLRQQSERRYETLFENAIPGMYRMTPDGRFLLANPALLEILQCDSIEQLHDLDTDLKIGPRKELIEMVSEGSIKGRESIWTTCKGEERFVRENATALRDDEGRIMYVEGTVEDLTSQQRGLAESEERFRAVAENSIDIITILGADGAVQYISPAVEDTLGKTSASLTGTSVFDLFPEEEVPRARNEIMRLANDRDGALSFTLRAGHADGTERVLAFSGKNLLDRPAIDGLLFNIRDITDRKRFEDDLVEARQRAEEITALKSSLLANMSHEIRTPLTGILGFAALLGEEVGPDQQQYVDWIEKSGNRLLESLNAVLALAQLESRDIEPVNKHLDVISEIDEVVKSLSYLAARKGLFIEMVNGERDIDAVLDRAFLGRILKQLITNAIKFTEEGGIEIRTSATPETVSIAVKDTGIGMNEEFIPHLFEEFKQESTGLSRIQEGSGLGLAITRRMVEALNGRIEVETKKGEGSIFTVVLPRNLDRPARESSESVPVEDEPESSTPARTSAMIVEDNEFIRLLLQRQLSKVCDVEAFESAEAALQRAEEKSFDIVFMDIALPGIDGVEAMKTLKRKVGYRTQPIIAVTGHALPGDRERFLSAGFTHFISKPFTRAQLQKTVHSMLRS